MELYKAQFKKFKYTYLKLIGEVRNRTVADKKNIHI